MSDAKEATLSGKGKFEKIASKFELFRRQIDADPALAGPALQSLYAEFNSELLSLFLLARDGENISGSDEIDQKLTSITESVEALSSARQNLAAFSGRLEAVEKDADAGRIGQTEARVRFSAFREEFNALQKDLRGLSAKESGAIEALKKELDERRSRRLSERQLHDQQLMAFGSTAALVDAFATARQFAADRAAQHQWDEPIVSALGVKLYQLVTASPLPTFDVEFGPELPAGQDITGFLSDFQKSFKASAFKTHLDKAIAFHWPAVFADWVNEYVPRLAAESALAQLKDARPEAHARLREALASELERDEFQKTVKWPWPERHEEEVERDGMAAPFADLLEYLQRRFVPRAEGRANDLLTHFAEQGCERLSLWRTQEQIPGTKEPSPWERLTPTFAATITARALWEHRVCSDLEREAASSTALVATVHAGAEVLWSRRARQTELELLGPDGTGVAWVWDIGNEEDAAAILGVGTSLTFQRLMRYLPTVAHSNWRRTGHDEADVHIEGGYARLAELAGCKSKKAAEEVRQALILGSSIRRTWSDGSEAQGLWTFHTTPAAPGRKAQVTVTLAAILRPGFVHGLPSGQARTLVPVVPIPILVGGPTTHGAQAAFQWALARRLAEGRKEAAREGGVTITMADMKRDAERVGLPANQVVKVLEAWQAGDDAFLERVGGDRWTIANTPAYAPARAHLLDQAKMAATGAKRGLAAAARKRGVRKPLKQDKK